VIIEKLFRFGESREDTDGMEVYDDGAYVLRDEAIAAVQPALDLLKEFAAQEWVVGEGPAEGCCDFCTAHRRVYFDGSRVEPHEESCIWRRARVILGMDVPA
jgi:hypothetical protein